MQAQKRLNVELEEALYVLRVEEATHGLLKAIPHLKAMQNRGMERTEAMVEADMAIFNAAEKLFLWPEKIPE